MGLVARGGRGLIAGSPGAYYLVSVRHLIAVLLCAALAALAVASPVSAAPARSAALCKRGTTIVALGGKKACVRAGQRCVNRYQRQYLRAGLTCTHRKLRKASASVRRYGDAVVIAKPGPVDRKTALQAFAASFGPIPGVKVEKGIADPQRSGSGPLRWTLRYLPSLPAKQRAAVQGRIDQLFTPEPAPALRAAAGITQPEAQAMLEEQIARLQPNVGVTFKLKPEVVLPAADNADGDLATTVRVTSKPGSADVCQVALLPAGRKLSLDEIRSTMLHEAYHCFQWQISPKAYTESAAWLWEGSAAWAEAKLPPAPGYVSPSVRDWWTGYLTHPWVPTFIHSYTNIGFYAHLEETGTNPWTKVNEMLVQPTDAAAWDVAVGDVTSAFRDSWSSGYFRDPGLGEGWDTTGPGIPAGVKPKIDPSTVVKGGSVVVGTSERSSEQRRVKLNAEVIELDAPNGRMAGRIRSADGEQYSLATASYCAKPGGCTCPASPPPAEKLGGGSALVAMSTGDATEGVTLRGISLKDWCKKAPRGRVDISGAVSGTITQPGSCSTTDGEFHGVFNSPPPTRLLTLDVPHYDGPRYYAATGRGVTSQPQASVGDGYGHYWDTNNMGPDDPAGGFSIDGENAEFVWGSVTVSMRNPSGDSVQAFGSWSCEKS
jgi:hypothetical protein